MLSRLPGWVISDAESVLQEVAEWVDLSPAERWRLARACARDAMWAVRANRDPQRVLDAVEPLPASAVAALARLQAQAGWGRERP